MVRILAALDKLKAEYDQLIPASAIGHICEAIGYTFRERMLGPAETFYLFLVQVLHQNTACSHLRHLTDVTCSVSAYCAARTRLPLALFRMMLQVGCGFPTAHLLAMFDAATGMIVDVLAAN